MSLRQQSWVIVSPLVSKDLYLIPLPDSENPSLLTCLQCSFHNKLPVFVEICGPLSCSTCSSSPRLPAFLKSETSWEGMGNVESHTVM